VLVLVLLLEIHKRVLHFGFAPSERQLFCFKQQRCARPVTLYAHSSAPLKVTHCKPTRRITAFFGSAVSLWIFMPLSAW